MEHGHGSSPFNVAPPPSCHPVLNSQKYKVTPLFLSPCSGNKPISISSITTHRCWKGFSFRFAYRTEPDEHLTKFRYRLLRIKQLEQQDLSDTLGVWEVKNNKRHFQRGGKVKRIYAPRSASFRRSQRVKWMLDDTSAVFFYLVPFATILEGGGWFSLFFINTYFYSWCIFQRMLPDRRRRRQTTLHSYLSSSSGEFERGIARRDTHTHESQSSLCPVPLCHIRAHLCRRFMTRRERKKLLVALSPWGVFRNAWGNSSSAKYFLSKITTERLGKRDRDLLLMMAGIVGNDLLDASATILWWMVCSLSRFLFPFHLLFSQKTFLLPWRLIWKPGHRSSAPKSKAMKRTGGMKSMSNCHQTQNCSKWDSRWCQPTQEP